MLVLLITLNGWTQQSQNWAIRVDNINGKDTIITYNFTKQNLTNLRTYVTTLEMYKERYNINTEVIKTLSNEVDKYKLIVNNKDEIIAAKASIISINNDMNAKLTKDLARSQTKVKRLPY